MKRLKEENLLILLNLVHLVNLVNILNLVIFLKLVQLVKPYMRKGGDSGDYVTANFFGFSAKF